MLRVGELEEQLAKREESSFTAILGEFSISDDATELNITTGLTGANYLLDDSAVVHLAKYLNIPARYLKMIDPDFRATLLRYEFEKHKNSPTTVEAVNGAIVALHEPTKVMLPMSQVVGVVTKVFDENDTVRRLIPTETLLHIDVTTNKHQMSFPEGNESSPEWGNASHQSLAVGDVTEAGVRLLAHPFSSIAPSVNLYAERLVCMNGMTTDERMGRISLKGTTVDEVINEMELAARVTLSQLDSYLQKLAETRTMEVPGSPQAFVAQLAKEANVSRKILDKVLEIVNQLPEPVTVWAVQDAFTEVANEVDQYKTMAKLQTLGGDLAFDAEHTIHRCGQCERLL